MGRIGQAELAGHTVALQVAALAGWQRRAEAAEGSLARLGIGQAVVDSIRAYNRATGPARIEVSGYV